MESGAKVQKAILYQNTCSLCPKSDLKHCMGECTCSWLLVCMFSKERLCLPFLDFLCPVLDARCQLPAHMHSLQTEPVSVFITSHHWTVKTHTHTHSFTLPLSLPYSFCFLLSLFTPLMWPPTSSPGTKKGLRNLWVYFILVLNIFSGPLNYCFCVKAWESKHEK